MAVLAIRTMTTSINGKIVRAVLQHQIGDEDTGKVTWEDVRELEVLDDGTIVLSRSDERIRIIGAGGFAHIALSTRDAATGYES